MQPQSIVTLSLPHLPLHQHHQFQAQLQAQARLAPMSPAPAQTPPLHTVPDLSHSPLSQQLGKHPEDFYSMHSDTNTEVDALDPSIMDFAFQGKQHSLALDHFLEEGVKRGGGQGDKCEWPLLLFECWVFK